jgi:hypothetical protein
VLRTRVAPSTCSAIEPAIRSMPSSRAAPAAHVSAGPSSGSAPGGGLLGRAEHRPLLGQHDERRARLRGGAGQAIRGLEVAVAVRRGCELHGGGSHVCLSSPGGLTRQSIRCREDIVRDDRLAESDPAHPGRPRTFRSRPGGCRSVRGGRPLKRWRWVGAFGPDGMACAARASIGGVPVSWWAAWDGERLHERMHRRAGPVRMAPGHVRCAGLELAFQEGEGVEVVSPHGAQHIWTRKQAGMPIRGTLLGRPFEGRGFVDDTAGYHARSTAWFWSAGVGVAESGAPVAWNLVDGVHDGLQTSERPCGSTARRTRSSRWRSRSTSPRSGICAASRLPCGRTRRACCC